MMTYCRAILILLTICMCSCGNSSNSRAVDNKTIKSNVYSIVQDSVYLADVIGIKELGNMREGEVIETTLEVKNELNKPIIITEILASCGCVDVKFSTKPIMVGEIFKLTIKYDSNNKIGTQFAYIDMVTNHGVYVIRVETFINK